MQNLLQYIGKRCNTDSQLRDSIEQSFELKQAKAGDILLYQEQRARKLFFIEKGLIRNYYYHDTKQVTSWFYPQNQFVTSWYSFYSQRPGFEEIECLEDCTLYSISYSQYQQLIDNSQEFGNFARSLAEEMLSFLDFFSKSWSFLSAKERYNLLQQFFPKIDQRVKLGQIATFIGISQETLSRIRS